LQGEDTFAIVPPIIIPIERLMSQRRLVLWVRLLLVLMATGLIVVFAIAIYLNPYQDGKVWLSETHRQLNLPRCTFRDLTGLPCPSCGMTSSFALIVRGDVWNSLRANAAGTMLAIGCMLFIPWALISVVRGQWLFFETVEAYIAPVAFVFFVFMFLRWGFVLLTGWYE